jgi:outer membrane lipoprotein-sorting protein
MAALGDILRLLHDAAVLARPARLTVAEWNHASRSAAAFDRFMAERHGGRAVAVTARFAAESESPEETSRTTSLSFESPSRYREEAAGVQKGVRYVVRDGERWASWDADWGAVTNETEQEGGPPSTTYALLLDPVAVVAAYRLEPTGETHVASRAAHRVRAVPRTAPDGGSAVVFHLGAGADELELAIDAERGALLRAEASFGGEPFRRLEVTEIAFGPLAPETFAPTLPAGTVPSRWQRPERLALHELPGAAPFPVFAPGRVPDGWRLVDSLFTAPREHPPVEAEVSLVYASPDGAYGVTVSERAAGGRQRDWLEWTSDGELETADAGEHVEPRHHVRVERDGTVVELAGADETLLAELARSLVPAPTEPPRIDA